MKGKVPSANEIMAAVLGVILISTLISPVKTALAAIPNLTTTETAIIGVVAIAMLFAAIQVIMGLVESKRK